MGKKLGGSVWCYNAISQDYCIKEAIESLKSLCDSVVVLDAGSTDGSGELVKKFSDSKTTVVCLPNEEWVKHTGKEKLSYFTNVAKSFLNTEWHFNLQADEVIHQDSFESIRQVIEKDNEGYYVRRINLWKDSLHQLNVPLNRSPVGTSIIRLAKIKYNSIDDGESLLCNANTEYENLIRIYHMGFIREKFKHIEKIKHIQDEVFLIEHDKKIDTMKFGFEPMGMGFTELDLIPIQEELPVFVKEWAKSRDYINTKSPN